MLDVSGYREVNSPIDQHGDMRLDIDHMSYEVSNRFLDYIYIFLRFALMVDQYMLSF